jgi:curved DNA-binding protein
VAKDDPVAAQRFITARKAYDTLIDPVTRTRYDRRGEGRKFQSGSFFDSFYKHAEQANAKKRGRGATWAPHDAGGTPGAGRKAKRDPGNDLDLDDLLDGFGDFGFGNKTGERASGPKKRAPEAPPPEPGADVEITLDVPFDVARDGGTVTATYHRLQRADEWRPGSQDAGVRRVEDVADVRLLPGTRSGEVLRERGLGDAGVHGGPYGDLVVRVRVVTPAPPPAPDPEPPRARPPPPEPEPVPPEPAAEERTVDVSVVEAMLGGRIEVDCAAGRVRMTVPPGSSSGTRLRLKGKAAGGGDLYVTLRIVVPQDLDDESRKLIEEFARLNPGSPRDNFP